MGYGDRPIKPPGKPIDPKPGTGTALKPGVGSTLTLRVPDPTCACEYARRLVGKTFAPDDAPKLPLAGCGRVECACRFIKTTERRSKARRESTDRRDEIRFEMKDNRRKETDRRKPNTRWTGPR